MDEVFTSYPARRVGLIFHLLALLGLGIAGVFSFFRAEHAQAGVPFLFWIAFFLACFSPIPWLLYRGYALWSASYVLERDGIRLRWGLRLETVPMDTVMWVRHSADYNAHLPRPWFAWPGAVRGGRRLPDGQEIEFMASRMSHLVLIATQQRIYAISPADAEGFVAVFRQFNEMGSLSPLAASSVQPQFVYPGLWKDPVARTLLLGSIFLTAALFVWVGAVIPGRAQISLRLSPTGAPDYLPSMQLLLLPVINAFFCLADIILGLLFYRRKEIRTLAYLLWSGSGLVSLLFMGAVLFITSLQ